MNTDHADASRRHAEDCITNLLSKAEPLARGLRQCVGYDETLGYYLKHPLVFAVPYAPPMNALLNAQFRAKREAIRKAIVARDFGTYVLMHEKPYRFEALSRIADQMDDTAFWELFADTYVGSENWYEEPNRSLISEWLEGQRGGRAAMAAMMFPEEAALYGRLPPVIRVYRGWNRRDGFDGYSWTLSQRCGTWYSGRLQEPGHPAYVAEGHVAKPVVYAYFSRRGENEIFTPTECVHVQRIRIVANISRKRRPWVTFDFDGTLHGEVEGRHPRCWWTCPEPSRHVCDSLRKAAHAARIAIVTRRDQCQLEPVLDFIQRNELPVEAVYPTSDGPKTPVLNRLRPLAHYDDELVAAAECPEQTTFLYVQRTGGG